MRLKNANKLGLIVSGTKRGKMIFFSVNIEEKINQLNEEVDDLRGIVPVQVNDYYLIQNSLEIDVVSLVHSISDFVGRPGYMAVSLVIPSYYKLNSNCIQILLQKLLSDYQSNYIVKKFENEMIDIDLMEDISLFENILSQYNEQLSVRRFFNPSAGIKKTEDYFLVYKDAGELESHLENYNRKEFFSYKHIFLLPESNKDFFSNFVISSILPPNKLVCLNITTCDKKSKEPLQAVKINIQNEAGKTMELLCNGKSQQIMEFIGSKLTICAEKEEYENVMFSTTIDATRFTISGDGILDKDLTISMSSIPPKKAVAIDFDTSNTDTDNDYYIRRKEKEEEKRNLSKINSSAVTYVPKRPNNLYKWLAIIFGAVALIAVSIAIYYHYTSNTPQYIQDVGGAGTVGTADEKSYIQDSLVEKIYKQKIENILDIFKSENTQLNKQKVKDTIYGVKNELPKIQNPEIKKRLDSFCDKMLLEVNKMKVNKDNETPVDSGDISEPVLVPSNTTTAVIKAPDKTVGVKNVSPNLNPPGGNKKIPATINQLQQCLTENGNGLYKYDFNTAKNILIKNLDTEPKYKKFISFLDATSNRLTKDLEIWLAKDGGKNNLKPFKSH